MQPTRNQIIIGAVVLTVLLIIIIWLICRAVSSDDSNTKETPDKIFLEASKAKVKVLAIAPKDGQTQVSWEPVKGADHYTMYYSEKQGFEKDKANTHNPITDTDILLSSDVPMEYYFRMSVTKKVNGKMVEGQLSPEHKMKLNTAP